MMKLKKIKNKRKKNHTRRKEEILPVILIENLLFCTFLF